MHELVEQKALGRLVLGNAIVRVALAEIL